MPRARPEPRLVPNAAGGALSVAAGTVDGATGESPDVDVSDMTCVVFLVNARSPVDGNCAGMPSAERTEALDAGTEPVSSPKTARAATF